jgi:Mitochondrial carrier protein
MKTQLQLLEKLPAGEKPKFTGVFSGMAYTVKTTGFLSLYRGLAPTLLGSMPKVSCISCMQSEQAKRCSLNIIHCVENM